MESQSTILLEGRFNGPRNSANGGYACGRLAEFIDGPARVRLHVPPPLNVEFQVRSIDSGVGIFRDGQLIAEAWPDRPSLEIPAPPTLAEAQEASRSYVGFRSHRYPTCFVCGPDQAVGGLKIFAGPVPGRQLVACSWIPDLSLASDGQQIDPVFVWSALDCPGGFAFPEPREGSILLGELCVDRYNAVVASRPHIVIGWEINREGRKHYTGTALFAETGKVCAAGRGVWLEVP